MNAINSVSEINNKVIYHPQMISKDTITARYHIQEQNEFFSAGKTRDLKFRIEKLKKLREAIKSNEIDILSALSDDLKKPAFEAYLTEIAPVIKEIGYMISNLKKWAKPRKTKTPVFLWPSKSYMLPEPYGRALIIGPWNYPFQLIMAPLVAAVAAGNTVIVKPSELAPRTSAIISKVVSGAFDPSHVSVVEGGADITQFLLSEGFDYIFFTGGTEVGRIIMREAAERLTPVTLELGGKSPVIVDSSASIDTAAKKIAWGKFINAGQTCIAPDYILAHKDIRDRLVERIIYYIGKSYGADPKESPDYVRIINIRHYKRIRDLMKHGRIVHGGDTSEKKLFISPTIIDQVPLNSPLMNEEIFGPVLPVIEFKNIEEAISIVKSKPKPLALYLFTSDRGVQKKVRNEVSSGGMVINDVLIHVGNFYLPFGGVGESGMGSYHGKFGFDTFSHMKSVMEKSRLIDFSFFYPPYRKGLKLLKKLFR